MKRITNKICAVLLSGIFMVMTGVNVNAAEQEYPPAEAVFPEEKVLQIENQIKNTPIYNDKDAEGNFSLKNTRATGTYPTRYGVIFSAIIWCSCMIGIQFIITEKTNVLYTMNNITRPSGNIMTLFNIDLSDFILLLFLCFCLFTNYCKNIFRIF